MIGRFEILRAVNGKYSFRLIASNGAIILSGDFFNTKHEVLQAVEKIRQNVNSIDKFIKKTSSDEYYYFVVVDENKKIIARSKMYATEAGRENGIYSAIRNSREAQLDLESV
jgi:uncharacterized protein